MAMARFDAEKFDGKSDFGLWRIKMESLLIHQGLDEALEAKEDDDKATAKRQEIMRKARSAIFLSLDDKVLREVAHEKTASAVWKKLEELYMVKSLANRLYLKQQLYNYRFVENKSLSEQLDQFAKFVDDLENVEVRLEDEDKAIVLLNALPPSYEQLKDALLYGRDKSITLFEVQTALKTKEFQRQSSSQSSNIAEVLNIKKFKGKGKIKSSFYKEQQESEKSQKKETRICHYCKKPGHIKRNCFSWKRKHAAEGASTSTTDLVQDEGNMHILNILDGSISESWIVDSGCSFHICSHYEWFEEIKSSSGSVILGNNQGCAIRGIGSIRLKLASDSVILLTDVRFIPEIKRNLVSLGVLQKKGLSFRGESDHMEILQGTKPVISAVRKGTLYYVDAEVITGQNSSVSKVDGDFELWHSRLGHLGQKAMKHLVKEGVIKTDEPVDLKNCEKCIMGKSKKLSFPKGKHTSRKVLEYAHSDIWGPAQPATLNGGRYFITIIDDFSRKLWVKILKEKSQAFAFFKDWHIMVEREKGATLKCLRTDNGLEYLSSEFDDYCKSKGIQRHKTAPRNPQQNGTAERMNRTIMERVRCMLIASGVDKEFWGEAVTTAAYLINRSPSSAIDFNIPEVRWSGIVPDYGRLKPFGCRAYAHIKQGKLEPRAQRCILLGYQDGSKAYRLWCTDQGGEKLLISRDVVFDEMLMPCLRASATSVEVESQRDDQDPQVRKVTEACPQPVVEATGKPKRVRKLPQKFSDYEMAYFALCTAEDIEFDEPASYEEAMKSSQWENWLEAMKEEIESLLKNGTWILVDRPSSQKAVGCKWIFKKKVEVSDENRIRFKARLVAKGYSQREGVDFNEVFSPVVKHTSIRVLLSVITQRNWELHQLDVKTAFLHGDLEETIYMEQPAGFKVPGQEDKVCLLRKSLYGLKQSSRQWYKTFDAHLVDIGFQKSAYDSCVYIKAEDGKAVAYLVLYVDDMLVGAKDLAQINLIKGELQKQFAMKDLGEARRILGMDIHRDRNKGELWLMQTDYLTKLVQKFHMQESKSVSIPLGQHFKLSLEQVPKTEAERLDVQDIPYANIVGSIMYCMICTRPDLAHGISVTSRYMKEFGKDHWMALKWILKYINGTRNTGILFKQQQGDENPLLGYCDSDYATNLDTRKSQTGYIFKLYNSGISWKSTLQSVVALSTTEAEYIALTEAIKEGKWLKGVLGDFGIEQDKVRVMCDSSSAICLAKHQFYHERSKHIDVRLHFIRDEITSGEVEVLKIGTEDNAADALTKTLPVSKLRHCLELVSVLSK